MSRPAAQTVWPRNVRRALLARRSTYGHVRRRVDDVVERVVRASPLGDERARRSRPRGSCAAARASAPRSAPRPRRARQDPRQSCSGPRARSRGSRARRGRGTPRAAPRARASARGRRLFGSNETRPRAASRRSASRMGVRLTANWSESCSWRSTEPARAGRRRSPPRARSRSRRPWFLRLPPWTQCTPGGAGDPAAAQPGSDDPVEQGLAAGEPAAVLGREREAPLERLRGQPGDVRRHDDVVECEQLVPGR